MTAADDIGEAAALAARAAARHIVVVGGGMAGLVAALQCARVGIAVTVVEASERLGGVVSSAEVGGVRVDLGADSYAARGGHVRALIDELGLGDDVVLPGGAGTWIAGLPGGGSAPLPRGGVFGIPANPFVDDVRRVLGWRGAWRAYLDRLRPVLTIGQTHSLGRLVRTRLGDRVVDRLLAPTAVGVYGVDPDDIDVDAAVPGLNAALTRTGSLLNAVAAVLEVRRSERSDTAIDGIQGIHGGMSRLVDALHERLVALGVTFVLNTAVEGLRALTAGGWELALADSAQPLDVPISGDAVIVATGESHARRLLAAHVSGLASAPASSVRVVDVITLVLDAPGLDAHPRGEAVLTIGGTHAAQTLTHSTARWPWLEHDAPGRHVVRVQFAGTEASPPHADMTDDAVFALALSEASTLLNVALPADALVGARRAQFAYARPRSAIGQADAAAQARSAVAAVRGLGVTGAWISGAGLAQVVPAAIGEGDRIRSEALWD